MTGGSHRINHCGHRRLNAAIHRTVIVRMRFHQPTIDYAARRTAEGKTKRETIRCLKRYVIRKVYHLLRPVPPGASAAS
jgi:transposase